MCLFLSKIDYNQQRINPRLRGEKYQAYAYPLDFQGSPVHAAKGEKTAIPIVKKRRPKSPVVEKKLPRGRLFQFNNDVSIILMGTGLRSLSRPF